MLVQCPRTCKLGKTTTDASLDVPSNKAFCNECGEDVLVSSFAKRSMEVNRDVIRERKKAFLFDCVKCKNKVEASKVSGKIIGKNCGNPEDCMLNITKAMTIAIENTIDEGD
jgi:hypothetical protein